ncbi:MAG TPA: hypothetical protein VJ645_02245 [Gaiellaceae bacterium]|nr:hypothetical protein [Gaiellaceae bacterium]
MKGLVPLLGLALVLPGTAGAEVVAPGVSEGALAVARNGSPRVAWIDGRRLILATRDGSWRPSPIAVLPTTDGRVAGISENAVLVEARRTWIRLVVRSGNRWRVLVVANAPKRTLLGASGLTLDASGRPAAAYALQEANDDTSLHLVRLAPNGRLERTRITKKGFPTSVAPPAAAPVLWPDATIRVVESFSQRGANAILWRREGKRWWGRVLHASALGAAPLPLYAAAAADGVYVAWTIPYLSFGENHLVLSSRIDRSTSLVLHPNAFAAALVLGPSGPEVAANEPVQGLIAGFVAGAAQTELDGRIIGYAATPIGGRQLLLARPEGLEWFELPAVPMVRVTVDVTLRGRVEGASSGSVSLYEEQAGQPRRLLGEFPLDEQGLFDAAVPLTPGFSYRVVYVDPATGVPYARLVRP